MKNFLALKRTFQKARPDTLGTYKSRTEEAGQMVRSQLSIKILGMHFGNSVFDNYGKNTNIWN